MSDRGFIYEAPKRNGGRMFSALSEFVRIHTSDVGATGYRVANQLRQLAGTVDPNRAYIDSLAQERRSVYLDALYGDQGCSPQAETAVRKRYPLVALGPQELDRLEKLVDQFGIQVSVLGTQVLRRWTSCMAGLGFAFNTPMEIEPR